MTSSLSSTNTTTTTDKKDNSSQPKNLLSIPTMTTPVPTTTTPQNSNEPPVLTKNQLNKLNSKIMKARLMNSANLKELEEQYEKELKRYEEAKTQSESKVL